MITEADRHFLLQIARDAITAHVRGAAAPVVDLSGVAARLCGAFVSIHKAGDLRGCIGHIEPNEPLGDVIVHCAVAAGSTDPRFPSVTAAELPDLHIVLSILGPLVPVATPDDIEIGRHGLVVELGWHRGLLLPQIASEWGWDRDTFLAQTCRKAGLANDAWKKGATIWKFEAEVFGELTDTSNRGGH